MLGGGGVLSALRAGILENVRRAKGVRRCCVRAARRRDMMGVWEMSGDCICGGEVGSLRERDCLDLGCGKEERLALLRLDSIGD